MFHLTGKIAAITGGASGIGRAISILFARQGAEVHIIDMDEEAARVVKEEINAINGSCQLHRCDVSVRKAVENVFPGIGKVDILVNSAGVSHIGTVTNTSEEDFDRIYNINVKGVFNTMAAAIPPMKEAKEGVILNLASIANHAGLADRFAYSMSKGAVFAMTLSVARDFLQSGIRCNCISPARVHTPFVDAFLAKNYPGKEKEMFDRLSKAQPIGRMATPDEVAHLALYLCSDEASFITGCDFPFDGGFLNLNN